MSFTRVRPNGFPANGGVTSAEMTQLDLDHSKAIDKTGDTVTGDITFNSGSSLVFAAGSSAFLESTAIILTGGKLTTSGTGVIELGNNSKIKFDSPRTMERCYSFADLGSDNRSWIPSVEGEPATWYLPRHNGATLNTVKVLFTPINTHTDLPAVNISCSIKALQFAIGSAAPTGVYLSTSNTQSYSPVSLSDYNDGKVKALTYTCNQNNTMSASDTIYQIDITYEDGANAKIGGTFFGVIMNYTVSEMDFV